MTVSPAQMQLPYEGVDPEGFRKPGPSSRYAAVARYLRAHPGEWRCIDRRPNPDSAVMLAKNVARGRPTVLAGMDVKVRRGFEVWARWPVPSEE